LAGVKKASAPPLQGAVDLVRFLWLPVALSVAHTNSFDDEWVVAAYAAPTIVAFTCGAVLGVVRCMRYEREHRQASHGEKVSLGIAPAIAPFADNRRAALA
jgi:hypothetical protein